MNTYILLLKLTLVTALVVGEQYTDRFDNLNIDEIVTNRRLLSTYVKCALDKGPCTAEGRELKIHLKDGMQTACVKCTDFQRRNARKVAKYLKENEKQFWEELTKKYDPNDEYKETYEKFLAADD